MAPNAAQGMKAREQHAYALTEALSHHDSHRPNRVLATKDPATGTKIANNVNRRTSHSSQGSETSQTVRFKSFWKNLISPPAF